MKNLQIKQISFDYDKGIVEIIYRIDGRFYLHGFSFTVWAEHNHFNEDDLKKLLEL